MEPDLVILAAGASTRMGHPKALTPLGGEPALARIVREAASAGIARIIVVTGAHGAAIRAALPTLAASGRVRWVRNPAPEMGRTGSLQRGLQASRGPRALVLPVDHPLVRGDTLRALAARTEEWAIPTFQGKGGHPLSLGPVGVAAVMSAPPATPLRDVPRMVGIEPTRFEVDDPGVLANLDTADDVFRWNPADRKGI